MSIIKEEAKVVVQQKELGSWNIVSLNNLPKKFCKISCVSFLGENPSDPNARFSNHLFFDLDGVKSKVATSTRDDCVQLVDLLLGKYGLDKEDIKISCSGNKGYHITIHPNCFSPTIEYDINNKRVMVEMTRYLFEEADLSLKFDPAPYRLGLGTTTFLPGAYRKSYELSKAPISYDQLEDLESRAKYIKHCKTNRRLVDLCTKDSLALSHYPFISEYKPTSYSKKLNELYSEISVNVIKHYKIINDVPERTSEELKLISGKETPCMSHLSSVRDCYGSTHLMMLNFTILLNYVGLTSFQIEDKLKPIIESNYGDNKGAYLAKKKSSEINYIYGSVKRGNYPLKCDHIRALLIGFSKANCMACPMADKTKTYTKLEQKLMSLETPYTFTTQGTSVFFKNEENPKYQVPFLANLTSINDVEFMTPVYENMDQFHKLHIHHIELNFYELEGFQFNLDTLTDGRRKLNFMKEAGNRGFTVDDSPFDPSINSKTSNAIYFSCLTQTKKGKYKVIIEQLGFVYNPEKGELGYVTPRGSSHWVVTPESKDNQMVSGTYTLEDTVQSRFITHGSSFLLPKGDSILNDNMVTFINKFINHNNHDVTIPALAWAMSTFLKPLSLSVLNNKRHTIGKVLYPLLMLQAVPEAGKTDLATVLMYITGGTEATKASGGDTTANLFNTIAGYNCAFIVDELNKSPNLEKTIEYLKGFSSGDPYSKESPNADNGKNHITRLRLGSPMMLGEFQIQTTSLKTRSVVIDLPTKQGRKNKNSNDHAWLHENLHLGWLIANRMFETLALRKDLKTYPITLRDKAEEMIKDYGLKHKLDMKEMKDRKHMTTKALLTGLLHLQECLGIKSAAINFDYLFEMTITCQFELNKTADERIQSSALASAMKMFMRKEMEKMKTCGILGKISEGARLPGYEIFYKIADNMIYLKSSSVYESISKELNSLGINELTNASSFYRTMLEGFEKDTSANDFDLKLALSSFCRIANVSQFNLRAQVNEYSKLITVTKINTAAPGLEDFSVNPYGSDLDSISDYLDDMDDMEL